MAAGTGQERWVGAEQFDSLRDWAQRRWQTSRDDEVRGGEEGDRLVGVVELRGEQLLFHGPFEADEMAFQGSVLERFNQSPRVVRLPGVELRESELAGWFSIPANVAQQDLIESVTEWDFQ